MGVVGDMRQDGLDAAPFPELYAPLDQLGGAGNFTLMWPQQLVVRTSGDPLALGPAVRRAVWDVEPDQPVAIRAMSEVLDAELANRSMQLTLLGAFAVIALVLAGVGLYGTLSYTVSQSTAEIGLRMALGAEQRTVVSSVVRSALGTAVIGIALGASRGVCADAHARVVPLRREPDGPRDGRRRCGSVARRHGARCVHACAPRGEHRPSRDVARRRLARV